MFRLYDIDPFRGSEAPTWNLVHDICHGNVQPADEQDAHKLHGIHLSARVERRSAIREKAFVAAKSWPRFRSSPSTAYEAFENNPKYPSTIIEFFFRDTSLICVKGALKPRGVSQGRLSAICGRGWRLWGICAKSWSCFLVQTFSRGLDIPWADEYSIDFAPSEALGH